MGKGKAKSGGGCRWHLAHGRRQGAGSTLPRLHCCYRVASQPGKHVEPRRAPARPQLPGRLPTCLRPVQLAGASGRRTVITLYALRTALKAHEAARGASIAHDTLAGLYRALLVLLLPLALALRAVCSNGHHFCVIGSPRPAGATARTAPLSRPAHGAPARSIGQACCSSGGGAIGSGD